MVGPPRLQDLVDQGAKEHALFDARLLLRRCGLALRFAGSWAQELVVKEVAVPESIDLVFLVLQVLVLELLESKGPFLQPLVLQLGGKLQVPLHLIVFRDIDRLVKPARPDKVQNCVDLRGARGEAVASAVQEIFVAEDLSLCQDSEVHLLLLLPLGLQGLDLEICWRGAVGCADLDGPGCLHLALLDDEEKFAGITLLENKFVDIVDALVAVVRNPPQVADVRDWKGLHQRTQDYGDFLLLQRKYPQKVLIRQADQVAVLFGLRLSFEVLPGYQVCLADYLSVHKVASSLVLADVVQVKVVPGDVPEQVILLLHAKATQNRQRLAYLFFQVVPVKQALARG